MPNYPVTASAKDETISDYGASSTTSTVMTANFLNSLGSPARTSYGRALLDTSAIGTDTITAATLYWYHEAYTKTKAATFDRRIIVGGTEILHSAATPAAAGWHSEALLSGELALINKTGETEVLFEVGDPGGSYDRSWTVRSWDNGGAGAYACYLAVTHAAAGGPTKFSILR